MKRTQWISVAGIGAAILISLLPREAKTASLLKISPTKSHGSIDVGKAGAFSAIAGHSHRVEVPSIDGTIMADFDAVERGELTIHGVTRSVAVPVRVDMTPGAVTAAGQLSVKQTDYGITPVTVAGVVKVKDALAIDFAVVAEAAASPQSGEQEHKENRE